VERFFLKIVKVVLLALLAAGPLISGVNQSEIRNERKRQAAAERGPLPPFAARALQKPWTVEGVNEILSQSPSGRKALAVLGSNKIVVWRVKQIILRKQRRAHLGAPWPEKWEKESLAGRVLSVNGIRHVWILDGFTNIEAALTVAHEASHTWGYREVQARTFEVGILTELPQYLPVAPQLERGWVKKGAQRYYVDVKAITKFVGESDVYRDTAEAGKEPAQRLVRYRADPRGKFPEEMDFGGKEVQGLGFKILQ
jgi:hypothetical protein